MISQHWFRWWLGAVRHQAITWANVDPEICRSISSLGHNELTHKNWQHGRDKLLWLTPVFTTLLWLTFCRSHFQLHFIQWKMLQLKWRFYWSLFPMTWLGITLILAWISNCFHYAITYPYPNFNGTAVEVREGIGSFIPHFTGRVITHPCCD